MHRQRRSNALDGAAIAIVDRRSNVEVANRRSRSVFRRTNF